MGGGTERGSFQGSLPRLLVYESCDMMMRNDDEK